MSEKACQKRVRGKATDSQLRYILCTVRGCNVLRHVGHFFVAFKQDRRQGLQKTCLQHNVQCSVH